MGLLNFFRAIFASQPLLAVTISLLFFLAGVLELLSIAMILPVLMGLLDSTQEIGAAGEIIKSLGFVDITLTKALLLIAVLMTFRGLLLLTADYIMARMARYLEIQIRADLFGGFVASKFSYLRQQDLGSIPNILLRETEKYSIAVQKLGQFLSAVLIASILLLSSIFVSWQLAALFVVSILPYLLLTKFINKKIVKNARCRIEKANDVSAQISENIMHLKYIKAAALEDKTLLRFTESVRYYANHFFKVILYTKFIKNFPEVFGVLIITLLILSSQKYLGQKPADIIFFLLLMSRGYRQISGVQTILSSLLENIPSYEVCQKFLKNAQENKEKIVSNHAIESTQIHIKIQDVSYAYEDSDNSVLKNIHLDFPDKGLIVLAGLSGSGKTTLADILLGLIKPQQGNVMLGDLKLSDINVKNWRKKIGYVPQDPFLTSGSIKDNILLNAENADDKAAVTAAKKAEIDDFIQTLPDKYEASIGFINTGLSGGQKQRIALARALAGDPLLLILDEVTSALDAKTEQDILVSIREIAKTKPIIMISHSIEAMKSADIIHVLEQGEVAESGTYKELTKAKGALARLLNHLDNQSILE